MAAGTLSARSESVAAVRAYVAALPEMDPRLLEIGDFIATGYFADLGEPASELASLTGPAVALTYWFDDIVDHGTGSLPWSAWLASIDEGAWGDAEAALRAGSARDAVLGAFGACERALWARQADPYARTRWRRCLRSFFQAMAREQLLSRGYDSMTYVEYLSNGSESCTLSWLIATAAWAIGPGAVRELDEPLMFALAHKLGLYTRLENDVHSWRRERVDGCAANAVLLLGATLDGDDRRALAQVEREQAENARAIEQLLARLGTATALQRVLAAMPRAHARWYANESVRYAAPATTE